MVAVERELPIVAPPSPNADAIPLRLRRIGGTPRQVLAMTLVGTLLLGIFASPDLSSWLNRMGDGAMTRIGLAAPFHALRRSVHRILDAQWPGSDS
jgi:hypothetical protein